MKSLLAKTKTLAYGILFSLSYTACSTNAASADESPIGRPKKIASWERRSERKANPDPGMLTGFFEGDIAKNFYETFKDSKTEYGGFMTMRQEGKTAMEKLYAFDDPSDDLLNKSIDSLVEGNIAHGETLEKFIRARDFSEMTQDPLNYFSNKVAVSMLNKFGLDAKPVTFYDKWADRIKERMKANMLPDMKKRDEQKQKWKSWLAPELKFSIVNTIYENRLDEEKKDALARNEEIVMSWHLHPLEIGPSAADLLISLNEKRYSMVLSARNERLHYWIYSKGKVIQNGLLHDAKPIISESYILPLDETEEIKPLLKDVLNLSLFKWLYWRNDENKFYRKRQQSNYNLPNEKTKKKGIGRKRIMMGRKWI